MSESEFAGMAALTKSQVKKAAMRSARSVVSGAFAAGKWVAASDACVDGKGRAAVAWAIFDPTGALAGEGFERVELSETRSSTQAEAYGALAAAQALARLDAPSAVCLCDCAPAIERLAGRCPGPDDTPERWAALSGGRFELAWVTREALGPANDQARKALDLPPEKSKTRPWGEYLEALGAALRVDVERPSGLKF
jgi:hypothetical protein